MICRSPLLLTPNPSVKGTSCAKDPLMKKIRQHDKLSGLDWRRRTMRVSG